MITSNSSNSERKSYSNIKDGCVSKLSPPQSLKQKSKSYGYVYNTDFSSGLQKLSPISLEPPLSPCSTKITATTEAYSEASSQVQLSTLEMFDKLMLQEEQSQEQQYATELNYHHNKPQEKYLSLTQANNSQEIGRKLASNVGNNNAVIPPQHHRRHSSGLSSYFGLACTSLEEQASISSRPLIIRPSVVASSLITPRKNVFVKNNNSPQYHDQSQGHDVNNSVGDIISEVSDISYTFKDTGVNISTSGNSIVSSSKSKGPSDAIFRRHQESKHVYHRKSKSAPLSEKELQQLYRKPPASALQFEHLVGSKIGITQSFSRPSMKKNGSSRRVVMEVPPIQSISIRNIDCFDAADDGDGNNIRSGEIDCDTNVMYGKIGYVDGNTLKEHHHFFSSEFLNEQGDVCPQLTSTELDPTSYQLEIPSPNEFLMHAMFCSLGEKNASDGKGEHPLQPMVKTSNELLRSIVAATDTTNRVLPLGVVIPDTQLLLKISKKITHDMLECAGDVVLEGLFFNEGDNNDGSHGIEVTVYNSQQHRQFIVVYIGKEKMHKNHRGNVIGQSYTSSPQFSRPKNNADHKTKRPVTVNPVYKNTYITSSTEQKVFSLLQNLRLQNPFCDVVFSGHGFGAGLAIIGASRYASRNHSMRVSCNVFGSPRIGGGSAFQEYVAGLGNLRIFRIENLSDPWVYSPDVSRGWVHVGHGIVMNIFHSSLSPLSSKKRVAEPLNVASMLPPSQDDEMQHTSRIARMLYKKKNNKQNTIRAYKFNKYHPTKPPNQNKFMRKDMSSCGKNDSHHIQSYIISIQELLNSHMPWITSFVGEEGQGVVVETTKASDNATFNIHNNKKERRILV